LLSDFPKFFAETHLREFATYTCRAYDISFYIFALYRVKGTVFMAYSTVSNMKSPYKSPIIVNQITIK